MMKRFLPLLLLTFTIAWFGCGEEKSKTVSSPQTVSPQMTTPAPSPANTTSSTAGVEHYICPDGHVGHGSDSKGTCSKCGKELSHNAAFHNNTQTPPTSSPANNPMFQNGQSPIANPTATPPSAEPAQNANGVWHYTCSNGCAGGAGTKGTCSGCGGALAHNAAYHN